MIWLGEKRGSLSDWGTQQWVRATGRRVLLKDHPWLDGPTGNTKQIGKSFFTTYANRTGLILGEGGSRGLIQDISLITRGCSNQTVSASVTDFYQRTSDYELDAWSEWRGMFRPFGHALAAIFSRRLQQLNVPLSSLDNSQGMTSRVLHLQSANTAIVEQAAWIRELRATGNVLYAGSYSTCFVPDYPNQCVKVVFPLPNGNAIVIMKAEVHADGSLSLMSAGGAFGEPGFYFVVHGAGNIIWARYVRSLQESIHVYSAEEESVRADHRFRIWGIEFLRIHYRMRRAIAASNARVLVEPVPHRGRSICLDDTTLHQATQGSDNRHHTCAQHD